MKVNSPLGTKTSKRNISKVVLISVSFFLLAIIGIGFWYWTTHKNKIIKTELENAIPTQDDRFNFSFNNIIFSGIDVQKLLDEHLEAETMSIGKSVFKVYRDLARPKDKKNRVGYYPQQVLDDVPLVFNIRKVNVHNSFVEYKERNHITRQSDILSFSL
jgi:hypothetical protein